jgi:hypothetical protein
MPDQQLTLSRLEQQSVPLVLARESTWGGIKKDYELIGAYLSTNYELVGQYKGTLVLVDRRRASSGTHEALALPCFG